MAGVVVPQVSLSMAPAPTFQPREVGAEGQHKGQRPPADTRVALQGGQGGETGGGGGLEEVRGQGAGKAPTVLQ